MENIVNTFKVDENEEVVEVDVNAKLPQVYAFSIKLGGNYYFSPRISECILASMDTCEELEKLPVLDSNIDQFECMIVPRENANVQKFLESCRTEEDRQEKFLVFVKCETVPTISSLIEHDIN